MLLFPKKVPKIESLGNTQLIAAVNFLLNCEKNVSFLLKF